MTLYYDFCRMWLCVTVLAYIIMVTRTEDLGKENYDDCYYFSTLVSFVIPYRRLLMTIPKYIKIDFFSSSYYHVAYIDRRSGLSKDLSIDINDLSPTPFCSAEYITYLGDREETNDSRSMNFFSYWQYIAGLGALS